MNVTTGTVARAAEINVNPEMLIGTGIHAYQSPAMQLHLGRDVYVYLDQQEAETLIGVLSESLPALIEATRQWRESPGPKTFSEAWAAQQAQTAQVPA